MSFFARSLFTSHHFPLPERVALNHSSFRAGLGMAAFYSALKSLPRRMASIKPSVIWKGLLFFPVRACSTERVAPEWCRCYFDLNRDGYGHILSVWLTQESISFQLINLGSVSSCRMRFMFSAKAEASSVERLSAFSID